MTKYAPICLFTYNRLNETKETIRHLKNNFLASKSDLFIFSDGGKPGNSCDKILNLRKYLRSVKGFKSVTVFESEFNLGLAESIISGVSRIIKIYGKVIVLEDDLLTTPNFLNFMNQSLDYYESFDTVQSINGFSLDINSKTHYFQIRPFPWGWATWEKYWDESIFSKELIKDLILSDRSITSKFRNSCGNDISKMLLNSLNGINDSWYVRWCFNHFVNHNYSFYPVRSFVYNIGFGPEATHCNGINPYNFILDNGVIKTFDFNEDISLSNNLNKSFLNYFTFKHKFFTRIKLLRSKKGRNEVLKDFKFKIK